MRLTKPARSLGLLLACTLPIACSDDGEQMPETGTTVELSETAEDPSESSGELPDMGSTEDTDTETTDTEATDTEDTDTGEPPPEDEAPPAVDICEDIEVPLYALRWNVSEGYWIQDLTTPGAPGNMERLEDISGLADPLGGATQESAFSGHWGVHHVDVGGGSFGVAVQDFVGAPFGPLTQLEGIEPRPDHRFFLSPDDSALAVYSSEGADEIWVAPLDEGLGGATQVPDTPSRLTWPAFSPEGRLFYGGSSPGVMNPNPVQQLYGVDIIDGVPQAPVELTELPDDVLGVVSIEQFTKYGLFFSLRYEGSGNGILMRAELSSYPEVSVAQMQPSTLDENNYWTIADDGSRMVWIHGSVDGLLGTAELIEVVAGQALEPQPFTAPEDIRFRSGVLSRNQRFALFSSASNGGTVYAADLDAQEPTAATPVGAIKLEIFAESMVSAGDWFAWRTQNGQMQAIYAGEELGETQTFTAPGEVVDGEGGTGFGADPCGLLYYRIPAANQLWLVDLSGAEAGEPQLLEHMLDMGHTHSGLLFASPMDERVFYGTYGDASFGWELDLLGGEPVALYGPVEGPATRWVLAGHHMLDSP